MSDFWRRGAAQFMQLPEEAVTRAMRDRFKAAVYSVLPDIMRVQDKPVQDAFEQQQARLEAEERERKRRERLRARITNVND